MVWSLLASVGQDCAEPLSQAAAMSPAVNCGELDAMQRLCCAQGLTHHAVVKHTD